MSGKILSIFVDNQFVEKISFHFNFLFCGNYFEENIEKDIEEIKNINKFEGL